jgi:hypothetical protein
VVMPDERCGGSRPNANGTKSSPGLQRACTIDATGHRVTPSPREQPKATVVFVGGWFTFGEGVDARAPLPVRPPPPPGTGRARGERRCVRMALPNT